MDFDPISFGLGVIAGGALIFFHGFIGELGKHSAQAFKAKYFPEPAPPPPPPEPILVDKSYEKWIEADTHVWVPEKKLYKFETGGYTYHLEKTRGAKVYRRSGYGVDAPKEFLMKKPPPNSD